MTPLQHTFLSSPYMAVHALPCFPLLFSSWHYAQEYSSNCPDGGEALETENMLCSVLWAQSSNGTQHVVGAP